MAITKAVNVANGEIILASDADCSFNTNWVSSMVAYFEHSETQLVSGPVVYKDQKGIQSALVTTAIPLNEEMKSEVLSVISKLTNKQTTLSNKVDSSLIGGFILRVGDIEYNASFRNKLKPIKQEFTKNTNLSI